MWAAAHHQHQAPAQSTTAGTQQATRASPAAGSDAVAEAEWLRQDSRALWGAANPGFSWPTPAAARSTTSSEYTWQQDELDYMRQARTQPHARSDRTLLASRLTEEPSSSMFFHAAILCPHVRRTHGA